MSTEEILNKIKETVRPIEIKSQKSNGELWHDL